MSTANTTEPTWDTADAFRPNSGRFGSILCPVAEVVEDAMRPDEIVSLRERLGWERRDLATHCGASKSTVAGWELGYVPPSRRMAVKLQRLAATVATMPPHERDESQVMCGCGRLYQAGKRCPECDCIGTPSPAEIAAACEALQRTWSEATREKRRRGLNGPTDELEIPVIGRLCAGRRRRKGEGE